MSIQIGNKVNFNANHQRQNLAFGSKVEIDDNLFKKQLIINDGREAPIAGSFNFYTGKPASSNTKKTPLNSNFKEKLIDKYKEKLVKFFAKNGHDNIVKISLGNIENPASNSEFMHCSVKVGDKMQNFVAMPTFKDANGHVTRINSLVRNTVNAYNHLINGGTTEEVITPIVSSVPKQKEVRISARDILDKMLKARNLIK